MEHITTYKLRFELLKQEGYKFEACLNNPGRECFKLKKFKRTGEIAQS